MDPEAKSIQCVWHMHIKHIITLNAVVLVAALASSCSKSQSVSPKVTISLDRGTNMTTVTTNRIHIHDWKDCNQRREGAEAISMRPNKDAPEAHGGILREHACEEASTELGAKMCVAALSAVPVTGRSGPVCGNQRRD